MSAPSLSWSVLITVVLGLALFGGVVLAISELIRLGRGSRAECFLRRHLGSGRRGSLITRFPVSIVAALLLCSLALLFLLANWTVFHGPAAMSFTANFDPANPAVEAPNTAAPTVGMTVPTSAMLEATGEDLADAAVVVTGPPTVALDCIAKAQGRRLRGYAHGPQARIEIGDLGPSDGVAVDCAISVVHRIRRWEVVKLEMTATNLSEPRDYLLYLRPPDLAQGQETAEALADEEIRNSEALWEKSSMDAAKGAFEELGREWPLIDPRYLHGFLSLPAGRRSSLRHLQSTRVQPSKIVTLDAVVTSAPVTEDGFKAEGSEVQAIRQVFAIGWTRGEQGGWCTTTRSTAQASLREGQHVRLRAAVVEWGRSEASGGIAVMLICPAVKIRGAIGGATRESDSGATSVPDRLRRG